MANSIPLAQTTLGKTLKVIAYVAVSAIISYGISVITEQPELFGILTPVVNVLLVTLKNTVDPKVPNSRHAPASPAQP